MQVMAKILIVEDDPLIMGLYETAFKFDGYDVATAADGDEGLTKIKSWQPTLVLLDIMMPKKNGLEVLEAMKKDEKMKQIPVVILTNLSEKKDAEAALTLGAVKFIVKAEHTPKQITELVKEILSAYTRHDIPKPADQK
jgi:CheY-like chemotaxis protein